MPFLPHQPTQHLPGAWKLARKGKISSSIWWNKIYICLQQLGLFIYFIWWSTKKNILSMHYWELNKRNLFSSLWSFIYVYVCVLGSLMKAFFLLGKYYHIKSSIPKMRFFFLIGIDRIVCYWELKIWRYIIILFWLQLLNIFT